jgi:hypothetical protein
MIFAEGDQNFFMKNTILSLLRPHCFLPVVKKKLSNLPEPTQTGANTFGAKLNGENWGPLTAGIIPTLPILEARFSGDSSVVINARNFSRTPTETEMEIYLNHVSAPGTYKLNQVTAAYPNQTASYAHYVKRKITIEDEWITNAENGGEVEVTKIDWENKIISGTFNFTAKPLYNSGLLTVTEGRFDVKIN